MRPSPLLTGALLLAAGAVAQAQPAPVDSTTLAPLISTSRCAGHYQARIYAGAALERTSARLHVPDPLSANLRLGGLELRLRRDPATNRLEGAAAVHSGGLTGTLEGPAAAAPVHSLSLTILSRRSLTGTLRYPGGRKALVVLTRAVPPIPPEELGEHDPGPPPDVLAHLAQLPEYDAATRKNFWHHFGPVFYRGRLDGSARVLVIASDPGPTECLPFVRRTLVGDAGQRVQGLLAKGGLTRSYVCVNAFPLALHPSKAGLAKELLALPAHEAWRNRFYDLLAGPGLQAIVALGGPASEAVRRWTTRPNVPVIYAVHPSSRDPVILAKTYGLAAAKLRKYVTPDPDADLDLPGYGAELTELDYARIPRRDLPLEAPPFVGEDAWGRLKKDPHNNCAVRPKPDDQVSLLLRHPDGSAQRYRVIKGTAAPGGAPRFQVTPYLFPVPVE